MVEICNHKKKHKYGKVIRWLFIVLWSKMAGEVKRWRTIPAIPGDLLHPWWFHDSAWRTRWYGYTFYFLRSFCFYIVDSSFMTSMTTNFLSSQHHLYSTHNPQHSAGNRHLNETHVFDFLLQCWSPLLCVGVPPSPRDSHVGIVMQVRNYIFTHIFYLY